MRNDRNRSSSAHEAFARTMQNSPSYQIGSWLLGLYESMNPTPAPAPAAAAHAPLAIQLPPSPPLTQEEEKLIADFPACFPKVLDCPISLQPMKNPITFLNGRSYERQSIAQHAQRDPHRDEKAGTFTDPIDRQPLPLAHLSMAPSRNLKDLFEQSMILARELKLQQVQQERQAQLEQAPSPKVEEKVSAAPGAPAPQAEQVIQASPTQTAAQKPSTLRNYGRLHGVKQTEGTSVESVQNNSPSGATTPRATNP